MWRRGFFTFFSGLAAAGPLSASAQQIGRTPRLGILSNLASDDPVGQARVGALLSGLERLGWTRGQNLTVDTRWGANGAEESRKYAAELLALAPDVLFAATTANVAGLQQASRTVPIVFAGVSDPVGAGLVTSLAQPGGHTTGFSLAEYGVSVKWLELLKEIAPLVSRVAILSAAGATPGIGQLAAMQAIAPALKVELTPLVVSDLAEIEKAMTGFARGSNGGLIVTTGTVLQINRAPIVGLAARFGLPAVYPFRPYTVSGGLLSYGTDLVDLFGRASGYIDRILKGEKAANLPVQAPTKYELTVNLKTAKALGLTIPQSILARADEVIE